MKNLTPYSRLFILLLFIFGIIAVVVPLLALEDSSFEPVTAVDDLEKKFDTRFATSLSSSRHHFSDRVSNMFRCCRIHEPSASSAGGSKQLPFKNKCCIVKTFGSLPGAEATVANAPVVANRSFKNHDVEELDVPSCVRRFLLW